MKVVNYSINTFYVLKMAISLRSLKLFLKKWEFKHLGSFPGLVPFQGDYAGRLILIIEVLPFWIPPTPREIRLKKLNVSPTLYCNVLPLTVYFIGKLMY